MDFGDPGQKRLSKLSRCAWKIFREKSGLECDTKIADFIVSTNFHTMVRFCI